MFYPFNLLQSGIQIHPLFGDQLEGEPHIFNLSSSNPASGQYDTLNFEVFQQQIFTELQKAGAKWGVAPYLEERSLILAQFPQMVQEERFFHMGLDIIVPAGFQLFAPLEGEVFDAGIDGGQGNYGGYVILKHEENGARFYSFYGHLDSASLPEKGATVKAKEAFAKIGEKTDSGGWFTHVHLQILTEKAVQKGWLLKGYLSRANLAQAQDWFPSPYPLFRY